MNVKGFLALCIFHSLIFTSSTSPTQRKHMSNCEEEVHTNCVLDVGSKDKFTLNCDADEVLKCLNSYLKKSVCVVDDPDTLPTIKRLISQIKRKFHETKKCKAAGFEKFITHMKEHFSVQGEGIEYTDPGTNLGNYGSSGSGDSKIPDDTVGDDDDGVVVDPNRNHANKKKSDKESKNDVRKNAKFWRETSRRIIKGKQNIQLLVFFDDPTRNQLVKKSTVSNSLKREWDKLKKRYENWYLSSKFNKVR